MSTRTKVLGGLAILLFILFIGFETEDGQRILRDYFLVSLDPNDVLRGSGLLPAVLFFVPGVVLAIAAAWSKVADSRRRHR